MLTVILVLAYVIMFIGGIMVLIEAFRTSVLWGIFSILIPIVSLIFILTHWSKAKKGFLLQLLGAAIVFLVFVYSHGSVQQLPHV